MWAFFHVLVGHFMSHLEKCLVKSPVINSTILWVFFLLLLSCVSCLCILDINPLSVASFAKASSNSTGCLFKVSIAVQKLVSLFQFSHSVVSNSLRPHELQHARPPCSSPTPGVHSDSCPSSLWCHPAISSSVVPFSSCPQSLLASESFPMSQLFTWGGQVLEFQL